jgi:hypothetical protein
LEFHFNVRQVPGKWTRVARIPFIEERVSGLPGDQLKGAIAYEPINLCPVLAMQFDDMLRDGEHGWMGQNMEEITGWNLKGDL